MTIIAHIIKSIYNLKVLKNYICIENTIWPYRNPHCLEHHIKLTTHWLVYGCSFSAKSAKALLWNSTLYFSEIKTGSYRQLMPFFPAYSDSALNDSTTSFLSGTRGSISLPYGVIVTMKKLWNRSSSWSLGIIGAGFFVQKEIASTTDGSSTYLVTIIGSYGFLTRTNPAFIRL